MRTRKEISCLESRAKGRAIQTCRTAERVRRFSVRRRMRRVSQTARRESASSSLLLSARMRSYLR